MRYTPNLFFVFESQVRCRSQLVWYLVSSVVQKARMQMCRCLFLFPLPCKIVFKDIHEIARPWGNFHEISFTRGAASARLPLFCRDPVSNQVTLWSHRGNFENDRHRDVVTDVVSVGPLPCEALSGSSSSWDVSACHFSLFSARRVDHWLHCLMPFDWRVRQSHG